MKHKRVSKLDGLTPNRRKTQVFVIVGALVMLNGVAAVLFLKKKRA